MPTPISQTALSQTFAHPFLPGGAKDIYGPGYRSFQGITDSGGGVDEIQDQPLDLSRARKVESYIFRAQDVRGSAIDSIELRVWTTDQRGRRSAVPHPALDLIERNIPDDPAFQTTANGSCALMRYLLLSLDGHGRAAWRFAFDGKRLPSEIYNIPPIQFTPLHGYEVMRNAPFGGLQYSTGGQRRVLQPEEVVYFQTDNADDDLLGTSKVSILRKAINLRMYSQKSNMDFFKNSMRPDWVLTGDWKNNEENVERIKRALRRHYTGESNREPLVLGEGATAHLLTTTQKDAEWQAMMRIVQEEISAIYGVPVVYLNNMERATYQNIETAKLMLWHDTMMPETKKLADMLTRRFLWRFWPESRAQGLVFGFDYNSVTGLGEDVARVWERFNLLIEKLALQIERRQLTPNDARSAMAQLAEKLGLDPTPWIAKYPDGDTFYQPFGTLPTAQLSVQAMIDIEAARSSNPNAVDLIESVPGAENAGENAQAGIKRITQMQKDTIDAQSRAAASRAQSTQDNNAKAWEPRVIVKAPHPVPIRDNRLAPIQKRMTADLKSHFQGLQKQALRSLRSNKATFKIDANNLYDHAAAKLEVVGIVQSGIADAGRAAYDASTQEYNLTGLALPDSWITGYMGKRINLINGIDDTTAGKLADTLTEGANAGETVPQLADRVSAVFSDAIDNRAETIARTETIQAYGSASVQSYKDAGIEQVQLYDGSDDPECAARDGQVVSPDEADALLGDEHPNGTLAVAPIVDLGFGDSIQAATFVFNSVGVAVA